MARLDDLATAMPGLCTLLTLRTAQAIVAASDRLPDDVSDGAERDGRPSQTAPDGEAAFAALLGWWYAPASREFIADDAHLRGVALALDATAEKVRNGCSLTAGLLDESQLSATLDVPQLPDLLDATLSVAEQESWPGLLLAAELSAGACGRERGVSASIARAVAPLATGLTAGPYTLASGADTATGALHAMAADARTTRRRVAVFREDCVHAETECRTFGRGGPSAAALARLLAIRPAVTVASVAHALELSAPTAGAAVERLLNAGLLREITGRGRDRVFVYLPAVRLAG
jgi:hypothetical protein